MSTSTAFAGSWTSLPVPLTSWILDVIQSMGHARTTPVQSATIPLFMKHKDVVVEAVTGSGKTLAFVIPVLEQLLRRETRLKKNEIGALIISPTRELATQIHSIFKLFLSAQPSEDGMARIQDPLLLISSKEISPADEVKQFLSSGSDIVVGTPGRIEEFLLGKGQDVVSTKELEVLVLDEADRLLDLGFQTALTRIITHLPKQRRTGLFSATMTDALSELVRVGLRNPARVVVKVQAKQQGVTTGLIEERRIPANLKNYYLSCRASEKLIQLARVISYENHSHQSSLFIVYFSTAACVDYFYRVLTHLHPKLATFLSLHGQLPPAARTRALNTFSTTVATPAAPYVLLTTDVAARGLDIPNLDAVIQFDPPSDPKVFSHRCGRTARAGRSGRAYVLLVGREIEYVDLMSVRKIPLKRHPCIQPDGNTYGEECIEDDRLEDDRVTADLQRIRQHLLSDRALHDQAVKAFVSFVRAYSKHEASYIFRVKDLDLIGTAKSYGLLRLPRMPELKNVDHSGWIDADTDWITYNYADPAQEAKRLAAKPVDEAEHQHKKREWEEKKKNHAAWSNKSLRKEEREKRKEKRKKKKRWHDAQQKASKGASSAVPNTDMSGGGTLAGKRSRSNSRSHDDGDDWDALAREERMAKKVRQGNVSQKAFDAEFTDL
ncbi:DEAD-domain-containing protein [Fistulina hepatica ATCC 64428]|uniref:ATP-dependent RNA helicase n=1 Tax=Fistulina hepatica ATCC 64428 TaxID=1128425 RepID=A0A0D7A0L1_9AGAR|nr:DEAD-domain-containing protein [Fistulina hepatica ATCC 64428]